MRIGFSRGQTADRSALVEYLLQPQLELDGELVGPVKDVRDKRLRGICIDGADLRGADLRGVDLRGALLANVRFDGADLSGADLSGAILCHARFPAARLFETLFTKADVAGAAFEQALHVDSAHWAKVQNAQAARWPGGSPPPAVSVIGPLLHLGPR